ncbi:HBS1-like protein [Lemmus lemmus]
MQEVLGDAVPNDILIEAILKNEFDVRISCAVTLSNLSDPAVIQRLNSVLNKSTGAVTKKKPKLLTKGQKALAELQRQRPVALELYQNFKELGMLMLQYGGP